MKKFIGMLSVLLIMVSFTTKAEATEVKDDINIVVDIGHEYQLPIVVTLETLFIAEYEHGVTLVLTNTDTDFGGSLLVSDDSNETVNIKDTFKTNYLIENLSSVTNDKVGTITANVGKSLVTFS